MWNPHRSIGNVEGDTGTQHQQQTMADLAFLHFSSKRAPRRADTSAFVEVGEKSVVANGLPQ